MSRKTFRKVASTFLGMSLSLFSLASGAPAANAAADPPAVAPALLENGFNELYRLNFQTARAEFLSYQRQQPGDPLGKAAEAASYLYEEFNKKAFLPQPFFSTTRNFWAVSTESPLKIAMTPFLR